MTDIMETMASRVTSPIFVGREAELDRIAAALGAALEGRSSAVLLAGEAGVGKTRLLEEGVRTARVAGFRALAGGCIELSEGAFPFAPFVEALRHLADELPPAALEQLVGSGWSELARVMPALGPPAEELVGTGRSTQGRLFELCAGFLARLAAERPLLLVIEDLHWADRSTLDLLTYLIRTLRQGRIVVTATYRSDELHRTHPLVRVLAELERSGRAERLELSRLDRRELAAQLAGILGAEPAADLVERVYARSQGNPFFAEELLAAGDAGHELPTSLREVLLVHLSVLSEPTQELLRVAAAGGVRVVTSVLASAAGASEAGIMPALREAIDRQIVLPVGNPPEEYVFRHALVQEALYAELLPGERSALHASYARTLSDAGGASGDAGRAAEIAHHWWAAHDLPHAFDSAVAAGLAAERAYAFAEARQQYERALELWDRVPNAAARNALDRVDLLERAAQSSEAAGSPSRAVAHIRTALRLLDAATAPVRAGLLYERLGHYYSDVAAADAAISACREAVRLVPADPATEARARVLAELGRCLVIYGHPKEAEGYCDEAIATAQSVGCSEVEAHALISHANCRAYFGDPEGAILDGLRARAIGLQISAPEVVVRAYYSLGFVYAIGAKRFEESASVNLEGFEYAERHGLVRTAAASGLDLLAGAAYDLEALGRWEDADQVLERARLAGADEKESRPFLFHGVRIALNIGRGRFREAEQQLARVERLDERGAEAEWVAMTARLRAELAICRGEPLLARAAVGRGLERLAGLDELADVDDLGALYAVGLRAEADLATIARIRKVEDEIEAASSIAFVYLELMRALSESTMHRHPGAVSMAAADLALCEAEATRMQGRSSPSRWAAAATGWQALGVRYRLAYALYREAEALLGSSGSRKRAEAPLRTAHAITISLAAVPLRLEIEGLAERGRVELEVAAPKPADLSPQVASFGLTSREMEVLALVTAGRTNRQIGEALFISDKTAGVHVSNILGKLGVAGRVEAATMAHRLGLIDAPRT
jgi:DNA-binding CsgD family transcriptional regulator